MITFCIQSRIHPSLKWTKHHWPFKSLSCLWLGQLCEVKHSEGLRAAIQCWIQSDRLHLHSTDVPHTHTHWNTLPINPQSLRWKVWLRSHECGERNNITDPTTDIFQTAQECEEELQEDLHTLSGQSSVSLHFKFC